MTRSAATAAVVRVVAAALALALSGVAGVAALHAPRGEHHCSCEHGAGQECDCGSCRRRSLEARASDEAAPPCHRDAAREALASEARTRRVRSVPCIDGSCGHSTDPAGVLVSPEPLALAAGPRMVVTWRADAVVLSRVVGHDRVVPPETPPPRSL